MALIRCSECDNKISTKSLECPHCGAPLLEDEKLNINNLISSNRVTIYYVSGDTFGENGVLNSPSTNSENKSHNFWLLTAKMSDTVITQLAWIRNDAKFSIYVRHTTSQTDGGWGNWIEFISSTQIENIYATKEYVDNKVANINTAITGTTAPTDKGEDGQIYVDTVTHNVYIYDGDKWQLMNAWQ